jgi:hypothetical protein
MLQETKQTHHEGVAFSTGKSIKDFLLEIMFKEKAVNDETSGDLPNLNAIHRGFASKLFEITNGDCRLIHSSKSGPVTHCLKNYLLTINFLLKKFFENF